MSKTKGRLAQLILFAIYGSIIFASKIVLEVLPNVHTVTLFIVCFSFVYGFKALIPTYIYVFLVGFYYGFPMWWLPYIYLWPVQCLVANLVPKKIKYRTGMIVFPVLCGLLGITYGTLYAPAQAIMFKLSFESTLTWIATGFPFDIIHGVSNFFMGLLVMPLAGLIKKLHELTKIPV